MTSRERLVAVLNGRISDRIPFAPNIWQWFEYHKLHDRLPDELSSCASHVEAMKVLGVDVFSRNLRTDIRRDWFGGHVKRTFQGISKTEVARDNRTEVTYQTPEGTLREVLEFQETGCTLVQREFLFKDFSREYPAWRAWMEGLRLEWNGRSFRDLEQKVGADGIVIAGEITSPLKQLHILARADHTTFLLHDHEPEMMELMEIYADKAAALVEEMVSSGVTVVMSMDNLDSTFYPPPYFRRYCHVFYVRVSQICHSAGALFFSHACGQQRQILPLVIEAGIDGLEGLAFPPLGDIELWEAKQLSPKFIVEGGLSAPQLEGKVRRSDAERYLGDLFTRMRPGGRFILSMSCNTSIRTRWDTLRHYRDAWLKLGEY